MKQIDENIFYLLILNPSPEEKDLLAREAPLSSGGVGGEEAKMPYQIFKK